MLEGSCPGYWIKPLFFRRLLWSDHACLSCLISWDSFPAHSHMHSELQSYAGPLWVFTYTMLFYYLQSMSFLPSRMTSFLLDFGLENAYFFKTQLNKFLKLFQTSLDTLHLPSGEIYSSFFYICIYRVYALIYCVEVSQEAWYDRKNTIWVSDISLLSMWHLLVVCLWKLLSSHFLSQIFFKVY